MDFGKTKQQFALMAFDICDHAKFNFSLNFFDQMPEFRNISSVIWNGF